MKAEKGYKARKPTPLKISPRKNGGGRRGKVESGPPSSVPTSSKFLLAFFSSYIAVVRWEGEMRVREKREERER